MLPPLVVAPVGPLSFVNLSFPPLVSALIVPANSATMMVPPPVRSSELNAFGTRTV
jgi:hypothetical protein